MEWNVKMNESNVLELTAPAIGLGKDLYQRLVSWAGLDPGRWARVHDALLRIYSPVPERLDARDLLVAWAAARLGYAEAERALARQASSNPPSGKGRIAAQAREADRGFCKLVLSRLEVRVPQALGEDRRAAQILHRLLRGPMEHGEGMGRSEILGGPANPETAATDLVRPRN